jgi:hypothetical protein
MLGGYFKYKKTGIIRPLCRHWNFAMTFCSDIYVFVLHVGLEGGPVKQWYACCLSNVQVFFNVLQWGQQQVLTPGALFVFIHPLPKWCWKGKCRPGYCLLAMLAYIHVVCMHRGRCIGPNKKIPLVRVTRRPTARPLTPDLRKITPE